MSETEGFASYYPTHIYLLLEFEFMRQLSYNAHCLSWQDMPLRIFMLFRAGYFSAKVACRSLLCLMITLFFTVLI